MTKFQTGIISLLANLTASEEDLEKLKQVFEKLDGSLGILFHYAGEWHLATQGSFYSDVAIYAQKILARNETYKDVFSEKFTFLFEIIYLGIFALYYLRIDKG